jgi:hypothetical protein
MFGEIQQYINELKLNNKKGKPKTKTTIIIPDEITDPIEKVRYYQREYKRLNPYSSKHNQLKHADLSEEEILKRRQYRLQYKENNKERHSLIINCDFGGVYQKINKSHHIQTKRHIDYVKSILVD